jgi:hypothetical protein
VSSCREQRGLPETQHPGISEQLTCATRPVCSLPSPVQAEAIPLILGGGDMMAAAETGTGKTGAFALPILQVCVHLPVVVRHLQLCVPSTTPASLKKPVQLALQVVHEALRHQARGGGAAGGPSTSGRRPSASRAGPGAPASAILSQEDRELHMAVSEDGLCAQSRSEKVGQADPLTQEAECCRRRAVRIPLGYLQQEFARDSSTVPECPAHAGLGRDTSHGRRVRVVQRAGVL